MLRAPRHLKFYDKYISSFTNSITAYEVVIQNIMHLANHRERVGIGQERAGSQPEQNLPYSRGVSEGVVGGGSVCITSVSIRKVEECNI